MDYNSEVSQRFLAPARVGAVPGSAPGVVAGTAEDRSLKFWIRFQVQVSDAKVEKVRYRAFACPHGIAAAERIAGELEGSPVDALINVDLDEVAEALGLPREKQGKLLRIQDALAECYKQIKATESD